MIDVELAKSIKVVCIKPTPDEYESFMYLWTCLDTGKMYLGIHKVNKRVYWHSSTSKNLIMQSLIQIQTISMKS